MFPNFLELAPPDPGLPPSLQSPGGESQPTTAEVRKILLFQELFRVNIFMEIEQSRLPSFLGAAFSPAATPGQPERADA